MLSKHMKKPTKHMRKSTFSKFRLSNKPTKLDDSIWKKISSYSYLVYDEVVWQGRNDCKLKTASW